MIDHKGFLSYMRNNGKNKSWEEIGNQFGFKHGEAARSYWKNFKGDKVASIYNEQEKNAYIKDLEDRIISFTEDIKEGKGELTADLQNEIKTLEELILKCKIDTTVWSIDKYVQNYWGNSSTPHWQVKAWLSKKNIDTDIKLQKELILKEMKEHSHKTKLFMPAYSINSKLLELSLPDLHIGKLAWGDESGKDYDIDIAVESFKQSVKKLLSRVNIGAIDRIHLPLGNDAIHVDNADNTTTKGTPVDTDGRFPKIIKAAKKLFIEVIEDLKLIAPVDVTIVSGNHDTATMFMLGEVLDAWYHNDENVNINNSPKGRKFYQYGKCGFMFTHGDKEKHSELGQIFAHEEKHLWADTDFRFCKLGHKHTSKKLNFVTIDTFVGFQVQILPSLSGTDEWHYSNGYLSNKQAKAFLYDKEEGEVGEFTCTIM